MSREAAFYKLNQLTLWIGAGSVAAVGILAGIAAATIPGNAQAPAAPTTVTDGGPFQGDDGGYTDNGGFGGFSGSGQFGSGSGGGVAVSGGSR